MSKISVIIPIYGVEKYIERCAHSLFQQTLEDIEYIFVDDCTKDNSIKLLQSVIENYPQRKDCIRIVRTPHNSGLPQARKFGLKYALGDFIIHCDSDDWVEKDMYETLYKKAIIDNLDIVSCDFYISQSTKNILFSCKGNTNSKHEYLSDILTQRISNALWNKLAKRKLYNNQIIHPTQNMGEDMVLVVQLVLQTNKIGHIEKPLYHYFYNPNSISNNNSINHTIKKWEAINENIQIIETILKNNSLLNHYQNELITLKENSRKFILKPLIYKSEIRKLWLNSFPNINLPKTNTIKNNILYILTYLRIYPFYIFLKKIKNKSLNKILDFIILQRKSRTS